MAERDAEFDAAIRSFQEQAARAAALKDRIAELRGSARNSDGSVAVSVAPPVRCSASGCRRSP
jgi:hypothetical protein